MQKRKKLGKSGSACPSSGHLPGQMLLTTIDGTFMEISTVQKKRRGFCFFIHFSSSVTRK